MGGDQVEPSIGKEFKEYVERRLATLEETGMRSLTKGISKQKEIKYVKKPEATKSGSAQYNTEADVVEEPEPKKKRKAIEEKEVQGGEAEDQVPKPKKKKKK